jgi:hypothetical protein
MTSIIDPFLFNSRELFTIACSIVSAAFVSSVIRLIKGVKLILLIGKEGNMLPLKIDHIYNNKS